MNNNNILKKLSIALNLRHEAILSVFQITEKQMSISQVKAFMVNQKHKNFVSLDDETLTVFLDNLITYSRGHKDQKDQLPQVFKLLIISLAESNRLNALEELIEVASEAMAIAIEEQMEP